MPNELPKSRLYSTATPRIGGGRGLANPAFNGKPVSDEEYFEAFLVNENPVVGVAKNIEMERRMNSVSQEALDRARDQGYDPAADVRGTPYEKHFMRFAAAESPEQVNIIKQFIDMEENAAKTLSSGSTRQALMIGLTTGIFADPTTYLLPTLKTVKGAAALGAAQESILAGTSETRSATEFALGVGMSAGGAAAMKKASQLLEIAGKVNNAQKYLNEEAPEFNSVGSAGSGKKGKSEVEELDDEGAAGAFGLEKMPTSPIMRMLKSGAHLTRQTAQEMAEIPFYLKKNFKGEANLDNVESGVRQYMYPMVEALRETTGSYMKYRGIKQSGSDGVNALKIAKQRVQDFRSSMRPMSFAEFREEVAKAGRRNDQHEIPEVAAAAAAQRRVINKLRDDALQNEAFASSQAIKRRLYKAQEELDEAKAKLGEMPNVASPQQKVVKKLTNKVARIEQELLIERAHLNKMLDSEPGGATYIPRMWRHDKIIENMPKLRSILAAHFAKKDGVSAQAGYIQKNVTETIERLLSDKPFDKIDGEFTGKAASLRERLLDIDDLEIEDFLENDIEALMRHHVRTLGMDIQLTRKFGSVDMAERIGQIEDEWKTLINRASEKGDDIAPLREQMAKEIQDVRDMRDRLRGTYGLPENPYSVSSKTFRMLKQFNTLLYMGGSVITALTDLGRPVMVEGIQQVFKSGVKPLVNGFSTKAYKLGLKEAQMAGTALDMVISSRAMAFADIGDVFGRSNKLERGLDQANEMFFIANLLNPWTATMKSWSGTIIMDRMLRAADRVSVGNGLEKEVRQLAAGTIDKPMAERISKMNKKYGEEVDGVRVANTDQWDDMEAVRAFREALARDIDRTIITPGAADRPLWMSTELGSVITQFKSFAMASANRVVISALQERDAAALNGALLMVGLGMMSDSIHRARWGKDEDRSIEQRIADGVDRSGLGAWFMDVNNIAETLTDGEIGLSRLIGADEGRPNSASRKFSALLGPSASTVSNAGDFLSGALQGELRERALRRVTPLQNYIFMSSLFDKAEVALKNHE